MGLLLKDFRDCVYTVTDFGAVCSDALQTKALQAAIDRCFLEGGGRVVVPTGVYRTGGLRLRSGVVLYLESGAVLQGSRDPEDYTGYLSDAIEPIKEYDPEKRGSIYPYSRWNNALIRVINAENVAIIGEKGSYIDGGNCYDAQGEEGYRGPHAINIQTARNVLLCGYTVKDSANWAHNIWNAQNIEVRDVTVYGGHDGLDLFTCDNVLVEDCKFYSGDDGIAGFDNHDVVVRRCLFNSACSALRFGGNHVLVEDCRSFAPARYGHRWGLSAEEKQASAPSTNGRHTMLTVFLYYCDKRREIRKTPGDIVFRRCTFDQPESLFKLEFDGEHRWCCNRSLSSIRFEDCTVNGVSEPIVIHGDAAEPLAFAMERVTLSAREGFEASSVIDALHFSKIALSDVTLQNYEDAQVVLRSDGVVAAENSSAFCVVKE